MRKSIDWSTEAVCNGHRLHQPTVPRGRRRVGGTCFTYFSHMALFIVALSLPLDASSCGVCPRRFTEEEMAAAIDDVLVEVVNEQAAAVSRPAVERVEMGREDALSEAMRPAQR